MDGYDPLEHRITKARKRKFMAGQKAFEKKRKKRELATYGINKTLRESKRKREHEALDTTEEK